MTNHSSNIKVNFEELPRLYAADESLVRMLQKIQEEIAKTDVEWMHLRSLVDQKSGSSNETDVKPSTTLLEKPQIKRTFDIDDLSVNQTEMNFSIKTGEFGESEEESD